MMANYCDAVIFIEHYVCINEELMRTISPVIKSNRKLS